GFQIPDLSIYDQKMNKENADAAETPGGGGMSEEQRARISQKFRAAKALLSRKRPRHSTTPNTSLHSPLTIGDTKRNETPAQFSASSKSSPASIVLDEDFDEAILEEIDALCEQKAVRKSESEGCSSNFQLEIQSAEGSSLEYKREAACGDISIPLMIVAGPGSGKTSTMVGRVLMLLNEGIGPSNILAMTFTTAAASEMRDRLEQWLGRQQQKNS
ncbi:hypothetical protein C3L33_03030, partial [Rhododendron williamsianum]